LDIELDIEFLLRRY